MKTGKYIVILISVAIVLAIVFLFNTVFVLSKVEINVEGGVLYSPEQIYSAGKIKTGANIFHLSVTDIKDNIENTYSGIKVNKIERKFPNKLEISVVQRIAMLVFEAEYNGETKTICTDRDFQMNTLSNEPLSTYLSDYTYVSGITINRGNTDGFDLNDLKQLRLIIIAFEHVGINSSAFSSFFKEIEVNSHNFVLITRCSGNIFGGARFVIEKDLDNFDDKVSELYLDYLSLPVESRSQDNTILA